MAENHNRLSTGCQLCQQGKWLCIFLTYRCNAGCSFCPAPFRDDHISSSLGNSKEEILHYLQKAEFKGISFSGGDPFLVYDRLLEWLIYFKGNLPDFYYWVYTSGLEVTVDKMQELVAGGMNEIRFNIAATGYLDDQIWNRIKAAGGIFPYVSVEIPSIAKDFRLVEKALERLNACGVKFLNLHDLILSNDDAEPENENCSSFILNKTIPVRYDSTSADNTSRIIDLEKQRNYNFSVNHCSMRKKELQMIQRRRKMGKLFNNPEYDMALPDGTVCNFYKIGDKISPIELKLRFADPDYRQTLGRNMLKLNDPGIRGESGNGVIIARYVPKMGFDQEKIFLGIKFSNYTPC